MENQKLCTKTNSEIGSQLQIINDNKTGQADSKHSHIELSYSSSAFYTLTAQKHIRLRK